MNQNIEIKVTDLERTCYRCKSKVPELNWAYCPYCGFCLVGNLTAEQLKDKPRGERIYEHLLSGVGLRDGAYAVLLRDMGKQIQEKIQKRISDWDMNDFHISVFLIPTTLGKPVLYGLGPKKVVATTEGPVIPGALIIPKFLMDEIDCIFNRNRACEVEDNHRQPIENCECDKCDCKQPRK